MMAIIDDAGVVVARGSVRIERGDRFVVGGNESTDLVLVHQAGRVFRACEQSHWRRGYSWVPRQHVYGVSEMYAVTVELQAVVLISRTSPRRQMRAGCAACMNQQC